MLFSLHYLLRSPHIIKGMMCLKLSVPYAQAKTAGGTNLTGATASVGAYTLSMDNLREDTLGVSYDLKANSVLMSYWGTMLYD